jgi:hypothetical protein
MLIRTRRFSPSLVAISVLAAATPAFARQAAQAAPSQHHHATEPSATALFPPREASGTAWVPDETPMFGAERAWRGWTVMLHGVAFAQLLYEPGENIHRTGGFSEWQFGSVNWGMAMARRPLGAGRIGLRAMGSLEPWTLPGCGALNLLATGEMCEGDTIHDRQHPHDLFMELAADYDRPLRGTLRWQVYAGVAGEPALGPSGFPHRLSAMPNPIAPISHHWLDSTHITFGLVTTGVYDRRWKAEMSLFNGREPDENRADLDLGPLDSIAGRLSFLPTERLALQVSAAHLVEAEAAFAPQPPTDVNRATASATYHRQVAAAGTWATTLAWGVNSGEEILPEGVFDLTSHAVLLESSVTFDERHTWFGRAEVVEKPAHDLHAHEFSNSIFTIGKLQGGYVRQFRPWRGMVAGIGGTISASFVPPQLASRYNGRVAPGFGLFLSVRPSRHVM